MTIALTRRHLLTAALATEPLCRVMPSKMV